MAEDQPSWDDGEASDWPSWSHVTPKRGRRKQPAILAENIVGARNVRRLQQHLEVLRAARTHGNRVLHLDNLVAGLLLAFFNPTCRSLRTMEGLSRVCQEQLGIDRLCRSTTADALASFDPALLLPILEDLRKRIPHLAHVDSELEQITRQIIAADGSYFSIYADVAWAIHLTRSNGKDAAQVRLNFQMDVRNWAPAALSVSGKTQGSETAAFAADLLADVIYLVDRNFLDFAFFQAVLDKGSDFVVRCKNNAPNFEVLEDRPLSPKDHQYGVRRDSLGVLPGRGAPTQRMRELILADPQTGQTIRVLTSLLDVPAYVISILYRHRWQIELFFRWLKVWGNFRHLISHSHKGLTIQFYVAVIGVLLMYSATGRRVSKYAFSLLGFVAAGQATLEDILPELERREHEKQLERERLARKRAQKLGL